MRNDEPGTAYLNFTRDCPACGGEIRFENGQQLEHACVVTFTPEEQRERDRLANAVGCDVLNAVMAALGRGVSPSYVVATVAAEFGLEAGQRVGVTRPLPASASGGEDR